MALPRLDNGHLHIPDRPGNGIDWDEHAIKICDLRAEGRSLFIATALRSRGRVRLDASEAPRRGEAYQARLARQARTKALGGLSEPAAA